MTVIESAPGGEVTTVPKTYVVPLSNGSNQDYWAKVLNLYTALGIPRSGQMLNGKVEPSVSGSNLVLTLKTEAGATPSADDPVYINIAGTVRKVTAATTCTCAAATNWMNLGAAEFATIEQDIFSYAVWDSADSVVALSASRYPIGRVVSNFNSTNTNEKHLVNYANFTSTDSVVNIGRFAATLSAGAGYTWSVPAYTNDNLIQEAVYDSRLLTYAPQWASAGTQPAIGNGTLTGSYQIRRNRFLAYVNFSAGTTTTYGTGIYTFSLPLTILSTDNVFLSSGQVYDASADTAYLCSVTPLTNTARMRSHATVGVISGTVPITLATSDLIRFSIEPAF